VRNDVIMTSSDVIESLFSVVIGSLPIVRAFSLACRVYRV